MKKKYELGTFIQLYHPALAEILSDAGYEWIAIDLEHSVISLSECEEMIRIISLKGKKPFVRLTSNDENQIKRVLDSGAKGLIIPMVKSPEEVKFALKASKYPPEGKRGVGLARAQNYGENFDEYNDWQKNNIEVIIQIEHIEAVNNLEKILSVEGISGIFIGPYDLSGSMGIPGKFKDKSFLEAIGKIDQISDSKKIRKGIHIIEPDLDELQNAINNDFYYIGFSMDTRMLWYSAKLPF